MERELAGALCDLGLTAAEAEIYVALLECAATGPVSAYKLAQTMGRDPANLTKTLNAMCRREAVRATGERPRLYAPVAPAEFTGRLIATLQERQQQALELLQSIGQPPPDQELHPLDSRRKALLVARQLLAAARRAVLVDGAVVLLSALKAALSHAAEVQGAMVLARCPQPITLPGVRVKLAGGLESWSQAAPGPWLRLAVDGESCLEMLAHPTEKDKLLYGHWSCRPAQAFLAHRSLASELILADLHEMLQSGVAGALACRQAGDLAALLVHQIAWRQRWREAGLPLFAPEAAAAAEAPAEQPSPDSRPPASAVSSVALPAPAAGAQEAAAAANAAEDGAKAESLTAAAGEQVGPLHFLFRRRKGQP